MPILEETMDPGVFLMLSFKLYLELYTFCYFLMSELCPCPMWDPPIDI